MNKRKIEIDRGSNGRFSIPEEGYSYNIVAVSESHKDKVKVELQGRLSSGELEYSVENPNDSPIFIHISEKK